MDEIRRLQSEVERLTQQLEDVSRQAERERRKLLDEQQRQLESCRRDLTRTLREHDDETLREFETRLSDYQARLNRDVSRSLSGMSDDYERLRSDVDSSCRELEKRGRELEQAVLEMKEQQRQKNEISCREALAWLRRTYEVYAEIEETPHEKFCPDRLRICSGSLQEARELVASGSYEAAAGIAVTVKAALKRLGLDVRDAESSWKEKFTLFRMRLSLLSARLEQELADWEAYLGVTEDNSDREQSLIEIDYWSRGAFRPLVERCGELGQILAQVEAMGEDKYLKSRDGVNDTALTGFIEEIENMDAAYRAACPLYRARYAAACRRLELAERLRGYFERELNYLCLEDMSGYREPGAEALASRDYQDYARLCGAEEGKQPDLREWYHLTMEDSLATRVHLYLVPVEGAAAVNNRIIIYIAFHGAEKLDYARAVERQVKDALDPADRAAVTRMTDSAQLAADEDRAIRELGRSLQRQENGKKLQNRQERST